MSNNHQQPPPFKCADCGKPCASGTAQSERDGRVVIVPRCSEHLARQCRVSAASIAVVRRMGVEEARAFVRAAGFAATFDELKTITDQEAE